MTTLDAYVGHLINDNNTTVDAYDGHDHRSFAARVLAIVAPSGTGNTATLATWLSRREAVRRRAPSAEADGVVVLARFVAHDLAMRERRALAQSLLAELRERCGLLLPLHAEELSDSAITI